MPGIALKAGEFVSLGDVEGIYLKYRGAIVHGFRKRGCSLEDAEDLLQRTFVRFLKRVERGTFHWDSIPQLLYRMARDAYCYFVKNIMLKKNTDSFSMEFLEISAARDSLDARIREILKEGCRDPELTDLQRAILSLRALVGMSEVDVANELDISRNKVRSEWEVIERYLKRKFDEEDLEPDEG